MARAKARSWVKLVAGLIVGTAVQPLWLAAEGADFPTGAGTRRAAGAEWLVAQADGRPSRAHMALTSAIDSQRRGDYEAAATLFQEAGARKADLTPTEQEELARLQEENTSALKARLEGGQKLNLAEKALREGRTAEANELYRKIAANEQYLTVTDKARLIQLADKLEARGTPPSKPAAKANDHTNDLPQARAKLSQARSQFAQCNFDAAERLAHEAEKLKVTYGKGDDTPKKVLDDVAKAKSDPKALLGAARAALERNDLDAAEKYAHLADSKSSGWSLAFWSDSPTKVMRDIETARAKKPATAKMTLAEKPAVVKSPKPDAETAAAKPIPASLDKAADLVRQARKALDEGNLAKARMLGEQAQQMKVSFEPYEDSPDKVLNDIAKAEAKTKTTVAQKKDAVPTEKKESASADKKDSGQKVKTKEDAVAQLRLGRSLLAEGKIEDAGRCAVRAKGCAAASWGLFEDNPDKLLADIHKARVEHDQMESARLLAEARKLLAKKEYDAAEQTALRAEKLHGPYTIFDLGDRPQRVIAEARAGKALDRSQARKDDTAVAKNDKASGKEKGTGVMQAGAVQTAHDAKEAEARKLLGEARAALKKGDAARAKLLADQVKDMKVALGRPGDDSPEAIYRDIEKMNGAKPAKAGTEVAAKKEQARHLMVQGRQAQRAGQLLEARQKFAEAQRLGVAFGPNEDSPDLAMQQVAATARTRIDILVNHASEMVGHGQGDATMRYQKAEEELLQAHQLAAAFGLDTQPVNSKLEWVRQLRAPSQVVSTPPAPVVNTTGTGTATAQSSSGQGRDLLDKARMELRNGQTGMARRLAEEACQPKYGVYDEAVSVLRSIDTEEFNQKRLQANRTFDAGVQAFNRRDYSYANSVFATIDPQLLDDTRQLRMKEIQLTPEMQASVRTVSTKGQDLAPPAPSGSSEGKLLPPVGVPGVGLPTPGAAGVARATDSPEQSLLARTEAMRQVKFQKLRQEGLDAMREATKKFSTGQTDAAVDLLQDYIASLNDAQLEPGQLTLLKRPVEARLQQLKIVKAQTDFSNSTQLAHNNAQAAVDKRIRKEEDKQKKVGELLKQAQDLFKDGKYEESEALALRAKEIDPDNPYATAAVYLAQRNKNVNEFKKIKESREDMVLHSLNQAENEGPAAIASNPLVYDEETWKKASRRKSLEGITTTKRTEAERKIERLLTKPVTLSFTNQPLQQVLEDIGQWNGVNIYIDTRALEEQGISQSRPVSIKLDQVALKSALNLILREVHLTYVIKDDVLMITTEAEARGKLETKVYPVADLVIPVNNFGDVTNGPKPTNIGTPQPSGTTPGAPTPILGSNAISSGMPIGSPLGGTGQPSGVIPNNGQWTKNRPVTQEESLIKLITNTISPNSWKELGVQGTIDYFPATMTLVVNQTIGLQEEIADLLAALRRLQDQQVSIEIRFISITEDFFERIGLDFNLNIVNPSNTNKFQPQLLNSAFTPAQFINAFNPKDFFSGLTPAGTLTADLNIPIKTSSFTETIPQLGGYTGAGGLALGLAFLSEVQVFLFLEAVQGDQRSNIMQAPKLTLFNGQTATLTVGDAQSFVTNVSVVQLANGNFAFNPVVTAVPTGVTVTMNAVISADRRYVRMDMSPSLFNIAPGPINLFPVVVPIFPTVTIDNPSNPILFTQFIQTPTITSVTINTSVAVPDGGTVILGGVKRLSEARSEFGPPILSKIPYINRLFKNTGYGRDTESLLIMVTPRIIILEEEEERATGFRQPPTVQP